ncbi:hypothetical protein LCGC14_3043150 [marine sediment metagenome]|uniref:Uncharacterized protein n=1 Tax=marine sediment metagenome TaxID=412755 RepID=A0A0F8ZEX0_9ZZZZ
MDALDVAQKALVMAAQAQTKIEEHEKTCAQRWGVVVKTNFFMVATLLTVLGVLAKVAFFGST